MITKGFKLGMMLQFAIGPVCVFIFTLGGNRGLLTAELAVLGVAIIDTIFQMMNQILDSVHFCGCSLKFIRLVRIP